ncbi:MAG TPA: hypothetical protein VFB52_06725 [Solirubrobacterales bacterium]|nr:hypothetical protein [Solirubrobacterales bacterium]
MRHNLKLKLGIAAIAILSVLAIAGPTSASAKCTGGGVSPAEIDVCTPTAKAKLLDNGTLVPPKSAPPRVKAVIAAANKISRKPYIYGGGHARWWDKGYDCSGAVSYALRGGKFLTSPLPSTGLEEWGIAGEGRWITVYSNPGHAYAVIAGYRWDTSGNSGDETGPRWHEDLRESTGFVARHPAGY